MLGTLSSYSVYQLSEATQHNQYVECESENMDGLLLFDANNTNSSPAQGQDQTNQPGRVSFMTGFTAGINDGPPLLTEEDDEDGFQYGEQKNNQQSYATGRSDKAKQTINKASFKPAHHLFDLLEMEISRHKSHTNQTFYEVYKSVQKSDTQLRVEGLSTEKTRSKDNKDNNRFSKNSDNTYSLNNSGKTAGTVKA